MLAYYGGTINATTVVIRPIHPRATTMCRNGGVLAMGQNFNISTITASGGIFGAATVVGIQNMTLEVTNGATATQDSSGVPTSIAELRIGSVRGAGTYIINYNNTLTLAASGYLRIGADGGNGTLEFDYSGGKIAASSGYMT